MGLTIVAAVGLVKRTDAFTLIELQLAPAPVTLTDDQGARFVINNTFGTQELHVQVNWNDAITGASLGPALSANLLAGQGVIAPLPAVQTPGAAAPTHSVVATLKLSPAPGAIAGITADAAKKIRASLEVYNKASPRTLIGLGLASAPTAVE